MPQRQVFDASHTCPEAYRIGCSDVPRLEVLIASLTGHFPELSDNGWNVLIGMHTRSRAKDNGEK